ncbi:hypothetical protein GBA52_014476 [Prunus armeniaca]|nr:hypothetical protein GBA52_014476 [Prunus armeniaca]
MYLASLINNGREVHTNGTTDPTALPAETVLKLMATLNSDLPFTNNRPKAMENKRPAAFIIPANPHELINKKHASCKSTYI